MWTVLPPLFRHTTRSPTCSHFAPPLNAVLCVADMVPVFSPVSQHTCVWKLRDDDVSGTSVTSQWAIYGWRVSHWGRQWSLVIRSSVDTESNRRLWSTLSLSQCAINALLMPGDCIKQSLREWRGRLACSASFIVTSLPHYILHPLDLR